MKKVFLFAVAAAALVACSNEELSTPENNLATSEAPVTFDVYTQRALTRGGRPGDLNNGNIGGIGFGVFAYYTAGEQYEPKATPNFMYNQKVVSADANVTTASKWTYEPVKYWPNEFGNAAISDEVDYVTFFAYAPWTDIEPTTGNIVPKQPAAGSDEETVDHQQKYNIISVNKNTASGDPIIKYVVDTDPATSVDLLWGVAAEDANKVYSPIDGDANANPAGQNKDVKIEAGLPFLNLVKPNNPRSDRLMFNLKHALAKVKVTIDYIKDDFTPAESYDVTSPDGQPQGADKKIDAKTTRIYVRSFKMSGFATKGALNLNNAIAGEPLWKDFDGVKDLSFEDVVFQDGRKDGKEGETNGTQNNETPQGLNPLIIENYCQVNDQYQFVDYDATAGTGKNPGVLDTPQLLFGGDVTKNDGFFYVIPRNEGTPVDVTIAYDVETIDKNLAGKLSDGETHGISIENIISKENIFGGLDFKAGYQYEVNIHIGMTSVKIEATVTDWIDTGKTDVELPDNQEAYNEYYWKIDGSDIIYTSDPTEVTLTADKIFIVDDETSFDAAYGTQANPGPLYGYYNYEYSNRNAWLDPDPITGKPSWRGLSTVKHDPDAGFGLPWVAIDLTQTPTFQGTLSVTYKGAAVLTDWPGRTANTGNQNYVIIDSKDFVAAGAPNTCELTWDDATGGPWIKPNNYTRLSASDIKVTLKRNNVTRYSYTTNAPAPVQQP
jgi:hypothetical protein